MKRSVAAGEFKAKCLGLLDEVSKTGKEIVITKRGRPVARLVPVETPPKQIAGTMAGTAEILGDIVSPLEEPWEADA